MLSKLMALVKANLIFTLRDRILLAVLATALVMILLVPSLSTFSMQQVQELAITLALSSVSLVMLIITLLLGTTAIFRDIDRRYIASIMTLPIDRSTYLLAKFFAMIFFLAAATVIMSAGAIIVINLSAAQYPSEMPILWGNIFLAVAGDFFKFVLLSSVALLLSSVSTSFFLPFFGTLAIYLSGSASQEVFEFVSGEFGQDISPFALKAIKVTYYLLPNFSAFDFKVHAIYALPISMSSILLSVGYGLLYCVILLSLAIWAFNRRQFT
jgi:ABC-type transport system involved in multi-copper enzyme maturation permease subunit